MRSASRPPIVAVAPISPAIASIPSISSSSASPSSRPSSEAKLPALASHTWPMRSGVPCSSSKLARSAAAATVTAMARPPTAIAPRPATAAGDRSKAMCMPMVAGGAAPSRANRSAMDVVVRARRSDACRHPASRTTPTTRVPTSTLPATSTRPSTSIPRSRTARPPTPIGSHLDRPIDTATATAAAPIATASDRTRSAITSSLRRTPNDRRRPLSEPSAPSCRDMASAKRSVATTATASANASRARPSELDLTVHRLAHLGRDADLVLGGHDERSLTKAIANRGGEVLERRSSFEVRRHEDPVGADVRSVGLPPGRREQHVGLVAVERVLRGARRQEIAGPADHADDAQTARLPARIEITAVTGRLQLVREERREGELVAHRDTGAIGEQLVDGDLIGRVGVRQATVHHDRICR